MRPETATPQRDSDFPPETIHAAGMKLCFDNLKLERRNRSLTRALWCASAIAAVGWGGLWVLLVTR